MPEKKYPGGYKIIDLGELDGDGTDLRPGLYDELINCNKPVIPTYKSAPSTGNLVITPEEAVKLTFCHSMTLTIGGESKDGCGWARFDVNLNNGTITATGYIFVEMSTGAIYISEI